MLHILIIEDNFELSSILQRAMTYELQANMATSQNARAAVEYLRRVEDIDLIITRDKIKNESTAKSIINYITERNLNIQVLALGDVNVADASYYKLPIPFSPDQLIDKITTIFSDKGIDYEEADELPEYLPFSLSYFKIIDWVDCDVYIKMTKGGTEKYLLRIHKGDSLSGHNISQYEDNPLINELFIRKEDRRIFYKNIFENAMKLVETDNNKPSEVRFKEHSNVYDTIQDAVKDFDIGDETVEVTNQMTKQMKKTIMSSDRIYSILRHVIGNPGSFAYKHSYLTALFSYEILKRVDFIRDKDQIQQSFEKLVWVAFFHDIYLKDEKLQKISNKMDFFKAKLTSVEKELVSTHANKASTLVKQFNMAPSGVDIIIKQHHGTSNGIGFTDFYKANISPLAVVFIVAEEFVVKVLDFQNRKQTVPQIIEELNIKFELPTYRKVLDALKDLLKN